MSDRQKYPGEDELQLQLLEVIQKATSRDCGFRRRQAFEAQIKPDAMEEEPSQAAGAKTLH